MIEQGTNGFFAVDAEWRYTYVSEEGAQLVGRCREDLIGERVWDAFPGLEESGFRDALETTMESREASELEAYYPDHDAWYDVRVYPTENGISIYFRDVTSLRESARQFEAIFNNTYTFVGLLDPDGTLLEANNTALQFGGLDRADVIGEPIWDSYWFRSSQAARDVAREAVETARRGEVFQDDVRVRGEEREAVIDFTVKPVFNGNGEVTYLIPEGHDITTLESVTRELREERDFIEKALDTLTDLFYVVDTDGQLSRWNGRFSEVTGYTDEELAAMDVLEFFPERDRRRITTAIEDTLTDGRAVVEAELRTSDGECIPYEFTGARLTDPEGGLLGLVGIGRDISDKKARERELETQREHLEALNSLNAVVRDVTDAVIEQSTRAEIERITCEKLAASDSYTHAWILDTDAGSAAADLEARTGTTDEGSTYADLVAHLRPSLEQTPVWETVRTGDTAVARDIVGEPAFEPWQAAADTFGFRSFISVPIVHDETQFGVLGIHSRRTNAFGRDEQEIIEQLGEVIGYVYYSIERRELLGSAIELEFRSERLATPFPDHKDVDLSLEASVTLDGADGEFIEYWELDETYIEDFHRAVERHDPELDVRLLSILEGTARLEVSGDSDSMSRVFTAQDGTIQSVSQNGEAIHVVSRFPESVDPDAVTRDIRRTFPDAELVGQRRVLTPQYLQQTVEETLTERQQTVLQLAYFGEYFGHPRQRTGEELADTMGITKQTFHHHLRKAESNVLELIFEDPDDPLI